MGPSAPSTLLLIHSCERQHCLHPRAQHRLACDGAGDSGSLARDDDEEEEELDSGDDDVADLEDLNEEEVRWQSPSYLLPLLPHGPEPCVFKLYI